MRYAKRTLSRKNVARLGLFDPDHVRKLLDYDTGDVHGGRHGLKLWMVLTLMLWYEQIVESELPRASEPQRWGQTRSAPGRELPMEARP